MTFYVGPPWLSKLARGHADHGAGMCRLIMALESPGTNELPIRPKSLIITPRNDFFMPRSILMFPDVKIPIESEKNNNFLKNKKKNYFSEILIFQKSVEKS